MLAHPSCINVIAQSMSTENVKTKIQGRLIKPVWPEKAHICVQYNNIAVTVLFSKTQIGDPNPVITINHL